MAEVYCDLDLGTGDDDGTTWANAFRTMLSLTMAAGDNVWVKGTQSIGTTQTLIFGTDEGNPTRMYGVKSATTNAPPVQDDLAPGLRTGDANRAYDQTVGTDFPQLKTSNNAINIRGFAYIYGVEFIVNDNMGLSLSTVDIGCFFEECHIKVGDGNQASRFLQSGTTSSATHSFNYFLNCKITFGNSASQGIDALRSPGGLEFHGCEFKITTTSPSFLVKSSVGAASISIYFIGCDISDFTGNLVDTQDIGGGVVEFWNCLLNSSVGLAAGTTESRFRVENHYSEADGSAKTSGQSRQALEIETDSGTIEEEVTVVRTGGASDGATGSFAWKMTSVANQTRDNILALISPWMIALVEGDGTNKTLTVFIANSSASTDYQDDEVWLEARYPSEAGGAQHALKTNQMQLLGTAANITDDTGSTWGSGGNNHQKLELTVAPDFTGPLYCRVYFAKNFSSSPESLFVDPRLEVA